MKYITFTVPCYNSAPYMRRCIDSLLPFRDYVEIIIINDGSTDATPEIADEYALRFPETVKVIHKANGGHGSGVNAGLAHASCKYFKVVDSDDWLDRRSSKNPAAHDALGKTGKTGGYDRLQLRLRSFI